MNSEAHFEGATMPHQNRQLQYAIAAVLSTDCEICRGTDGQLKREPERVS